MEISQKTEEIILQIQRLSEDRLSITEQLLILQTELVESYEQDKMNDEKKS